MEIAASHSLRFSASDLYEPVHGHNWRITVYCASETLDEDGLVVDFCEIERRVAGVLDHSDLNEVLPCNPSTENLARWIFDRVPKCYKVDVEESSDAAASYER